MAEAHALVDLRSEPNWDPATLTAETFEWPPHATHLLPLREIATRLAPRFIADAGSPVITPQGIDPLSGGVRRRTRKYQGSVFQVGAELRVGDVLIPRTGTGPTVYVSDRLAGALVSAQFGALRPEDSELGYWVWALLGSESGARLRISLSRGDVATHVEVAALLGVSVPLPRLPERQRLIARIRDLERTTHIEEEEPAQTWWHLADLRELPWHIALAAPDRALLEDDGTPLQILCGEIVRGRNTRRTASTEPVPDYLPVSDVSVLGGKSPRRWMSPSDPTAIVARPGDLLVAGLGNYSYATVVDRESVADQHVFVLRLREVSAGSAIARYLNSERGYRLRQMMLTGSTIPSLRAADLASIRIPENAPHALAEPDVLSVPIARRLENVLWRN